MLEVKSNVMSDNVVHSSLFTVKNKAKHRFALQGGNKMFISRRELFLKALPLFFFAIFGSVLLVLSAMPTMAYSGGKVTSKNTPVPIKIDGELNDAAWNAVRPDAVGQEIVVDPQDWYQIIPGGGTGSNTNNGGLRVTRGQIDGDADLKVIWMTLWDDEYLYFAFEVTDDNVTEYQGPFDVRSGDVDGFLLIFDTKHDAPVIEFPPKEFDTAVVKAQSVFEADDVFWTTAPLTNRGAPAVFENPAAAENPVLNDPANGHVAGKKTSIGYNAEVRLPWSVFEPFYGGPLVPTDGLVVGFDISFTDIDPTYAAPEGGAMAWSSDFENDNSPGVLGELFISAEVITAVDPAGKLPAMWGRIKAEHK